jgi:hypothetical protein
MMSIVIYEMAVILLYLSVRALWPELFVNRKLAKAPARATRRNRSGLVTPAHFVRHSRQTDPARSAGIGMLIR